jgi:hypothetical protein
LLADLLQLQFNQFAPDDSVLGGLPEARIALAFPLGFETFQTGYCFSQPMPVCVGVAWRVVRAAGGALLLQSQKWLIGWNPTAPKERIRDRPQNPSDGRFVPL